VHRGANVQKEQSFDLETLVDDEHAWNIFCHVYAGSTELQRATKWAELSAEQRRVSSYMKYVPPPSSELPLATRQVAAGHARQAAAWHGRADG